MPITFEGPAALVADIATSRTFYEQALGQKVLADHGPHVAFTGGFSIWQADHAMPLMRPDLAAKTPDRRTGSRAKTDPQGRDNFELYFESADLEDAWKKVSNAGATIIHEIVEQPWGQRGFRVADPDGHVVEVAEPLPALVARLLNQGMTPEQVSEHTSIPLPFVLQAAANDTD